ncbi:MAG: hypothetical protein WCF08_09995 [Anaerolineaceae bacterium]
MKNVRVALLVFSALVMVWAVLLILWANWPPSITTRTTTLHLIAPGDWGKSAVGQIGTRTFTLTLTYPERIKTGQVAHYQMDIEQLPATVMMGGAEYQLRVRCELILPGLINQQEGMFTQSVQNQKPVKFTWNVRSLEPQSAVGVLRIFVDYVSSDNTVDSQLISVTDLWLVSKSLSGLSTTGATSLAVAFVLLAGLAGGLGLTRPRVG